MSRRITLACPALLLLLGLAGATAWRWPGPAATADAAPPDLPVPPFPPRITEGDVYESCLTSLAEDPAGAAAVAEAWQAAGGGDGAAHCQGLALVALGKPDDGAAVLERLAGRSAAPGLARASVLSQAVQARLMVGQSEQATADATAALDLSPADTGLLTMRAAALSGLGRYQAAVQDLDEALRIDGSRVEALVSRAALWRKLGRLDMARVDVARALRLSPDDADALLERGILRERTGDRAGARQDWERARGADPDSTTADLAEQNLSLLDAGPERP